ncbi:transglutaminase domain-containing protein, partial [Candidatus Dojkabacteria bacterium]|nr:transglutaminase domain-containing protein [Candidatus Dojkabacteria bacterium]
MTKLSLYSKVIITCLIAFVGLIFFISKVSAQSSYEVIDHSIEVDLFENGDAYFRAELTIINNDPNNVVSGYNYVLPAKNVINPTVEFDGQTMSLPVYAQPGSSFSNLEIDFGDNVIKPNSAKKIVINAKLSSFVKLNFEAKYILFQPTKDQINSFAISYPASFGVPLYISDSNAEQKQNNASIDSIKLSSTKNLVLIMWGDEYYVDVQTESQISNRADKPVQTLFELIPDTQSQLVAYNNITNGEFGLRDTYGNDFATLNLAAAESKNIGFEARIKKVQSSLEKNISTKYEINLPKLFSEDLSNRTLDNILAKENLENIYDYLIETYPLEFTQTKEADIQNFDEYLQNKKSLNSFDYSAVLATYAESLGLDAEIRYGYVVLKPGEETTLQPHFWVVVFSDEDSYIIDPYMEITTELHYFNLKYDFDRITFGVWH